MTIDMTRTNIKEDICHLAFVFVYRYAFCQCIKRTTVPILLIFRGVLIGEGADWRVGAY